MPLAWEQGRLSFAGEPRAHDAASVSVDDLVAAVAAAGYTATPPAAPRTSPGDEAQPTDAPQTAGSDRGAETDALRTRLLVSLLLAVPTRQ